MRVFQSIIHSDDSEEGGYFFIYGSGGEWEKHIFQKISKPF